LDGTTIAIVLIAILAAGLIAAYFMVKQNREHKELQTKFGPEYERSVKESGTRAEAERDLKERAARVERLRIQELDEDDRRRFGDEWRGVQARFVDDPGRAIVEADELVQRVMDKRGYPISDFETQAADISVNHPQVVTNYRAAHEIAETHSRDGVNTEELRQAMIHYRALFEDLLGLETGQRTTGR
jgi:hypothetical protein